MIRRAQLAATDRDFDIVVVGAGIHGAAATLEAARRGYSVLLLEQNDFGGGVSWNSLKIAHGGLRYLQHADLRRFFTSVYERRWLFRHFPDLLECLPCLLPLYQSGIERRSVFRAALVLNDLLALSRNRGVLPSKILSRGRVLGREETARIFPGVRRRDLRGAALWHDGFLPNSHRLIIEMLHWASAAGAECANYAKVVGFDTAQGSVRGVSVIDRLGSGDPLTIRTRGVINCAGPNCRRLAASFDRDDPSIFHPIVGFNLLLDASPVSSHAVAVRPEDVSGRYLFACPWKGRLLVGTQYLSVAQTDEGGAPNEQTIGEFLNLVNRSIEGLTLTADQIVHVFWGLLPAVEEGSLSPAREVRILDHSTQGGPPGIFTVSGVKLTTARHVAETVLRLYSRFRGIDRLPLAEGDRPPSREAWELSEFLVRVEADAESVDRELAEWLTSESVVRPEDFLFRRVDWPLLKAWNAETLGRLRSLPTWRELEKTDSDRFGTEGP